LDDGDSSLFLGERDRERVEFLEQRIAGLGAEKFVSADRERFPLLAPNPHPRLAGAVGRSENNEMLEIRLGEFSLNFQPGGVVWQPAIRSDAKPGGEPALLCEGGQRVVLLGGSQREAVPAWLPAEFLPEEPGEVAGLEERAGAGEV
jgi:hypothetical protein